MAHSSLRHYTAQTNIKKFLTQQLSSKNIFFLASTIFKNKQHFVEACFFSSVSSFLTSIQS